MLQTLRDRSQGWLSWLIVISISITFALWGIHSYMTGGSASNSVATVNGVDISRQAVDLAYERLRQQRQMQLGAEYSFNETIEKQLKNQAINQLLMSSVLSQAASNQGFRVANQQVANTLVKIPAFQTNGQFSRERFSEVLKHMLYNEEAFLNEMRTTMLINQVQIGLVHSEFALSNEVANAVQLINQKRDVAMLLIPAERFLHTVNISEQAAKDYYDKNQNEFMTPEQLSIEYIKLSLTDLAAQLHFSEAELKQFYQDNIAHFTQQKSHLIPFEKARAEVVKALAQQKGQDLLAEATDKLANLTYTNPNSLEPAAKALKLNIQNTNLFTQEGAKEGIAANPKVVAVAFSPAVLAQNNSDVITISPTEAIVLRIKQHKAAAVVPFAEVKTIISQRLKNVAAQEQAQKLGKTLLEQFTKGASGLQLAKQYNLKWSVMPDAGRYDTRVNPLLLQEAFRLPAPASKDKPSANGVPLPNGDYALVALTGVRHGDISKLSATQQRVFTTEIQNGLGQLDYALYANGVLQRSKVKVRQENSKAAE